MTDQSVIEVPIPDFDLFVNQAREKFNEVELKQLAENIRQNGLLQPGVAWYDEGRGRLILICGERRYRAIKEAGLPTMAVKVIRGPLTQAQLLEINVSENIQRSSLNPIERAKAFRRLMQLEDITGREVASRLKVSEATVSRDVALLELSPELQAKVSSGELPSSVGATLARLDDDETRRFLADQFTSGIIGRDEVTAAVNSKLKGDRPPRSQPSRLSGRLDGGVTLSVTCREKLTREVIKRVIEHLQAEAKKLPASLPVVSVAEG